MVVFVAGIIPCASEGVGPLNNTTHGKTACFDGLATGSPRGPRTPLDLLPTARRGSFPKPRHHQIYPCPPDCHRQGQEPRSDTLRACSSFTLRAITFVQHNFLLWYIDATLVMATSTITQRNESSPPQGSPAPPAFCTQHK